MKPLKEKALSLKEAANNTAVALKEAVDNKAASLKEKAALLKKGGQAAGQETEDDDGDDRPKEELQVPEAFAKWLTGRRNKKTDNPDERQTVIKTVEKGTGVELHIDPSPADLGLKKLVIYGEDSQRQKAKSMMQDIRSRTQMDSLTDAVDSWASRGLSCELSDWSSIDDGRGQGAFENMSITPCQYRNAVPVTC